MTNNPCSLNHTAIVEKTRCLFILLLGSFAIGCSDQNQYIEPPPATVTVAFPVQQEVTEYLEFTGTTRPVGIAEIRAQVSGVLQSMHFEAGTQVDQGDLLFIIDPRPYLADLHAAEADLASAKAEYHRTQVELERADQLIKKNFISKTDHLRRLTERNVAKANIARIQARVENARIKLDYTRVTAPIAGRVSRNSVDIGNLVGEGEATLLTTITQNQPIYAYFHLNERDLLKIMKVHREVAQDKGIDADKRPNADLDIPVYLALANEENYPHRGILDYAESFVNTETGTIELRGVFSNDAKPRQLIGGLFVKLRIPVDKKSEALLVDERALAADQSGDYLLIVNKDHVVEKRNIIKSQVIDGLMVIKKGIQANDLVIINGLQRARPGIKVNPQRAEMIRSPDLLKPSENNKSTPEKKNKNTGNGHSTTPGHG